MNHFETIISQRHLLNIQGTSKYMFNNSYFAFIHQMVSQQHESSFKN
jgi:hypothetical protein